MGLIRIVVWASDGKPLAGLNVDLNSTDPAAAGAPPAGKGTTDQEGVVRFRVQPGTYKLAFTNLPQNLKPPKYGTTVRLEDFAEGIEQIVKLAPAAQPVA